MNNNDYPIKIIRIDSIEKTFKPSFFNIDALTEKWHLVHSLYIHKDNLYKELLEQGHHINKSINLIKQENHDTSISGIKERNKERQAEHVEALKPQLLAWNREGRDENQYQQLCKQQDKQVQNLCNEFKKLSPYIDNEILFDGLAGHFQHQKELRNYVNKVVFHIMPFDNAFKADVLAKFDYHNIQSHLGERNIGIISKQEKLDKLKEVFRIQLRKTDISDNVLSDFFSCFFKTSRTGANDKILGLNPLDLPTPIQYITGNINPLDLFIFP